MMATFIHVLQIFYFYVFVAFAQYKKTCNPMNYGAKGDGKTDDTNAIQKAINDCYLNNNEGLVSFASGKSFLSFPLNITNVNNIGFEIEGTLILSNDRSKWPKNENFIQLTDVTNIQIFGKGLINGQGLIWWQNKNDFRPHTIDAKGVKHLLIKDITI
eukprot:460920_1